MKSANTLLVCLFFLFAWSNHPSHAQEPKTLRMAIHIFQDEGGGGNFHQDSSAHEAFLQDLITWVNHKALHLNSLRPAFTSEYVPSLGIQIRIDSIFYHQDSYAWNCDTIVDGEYMRLNYVDKDQSLSYLEMHQTLPIFIGANYPRVGGHVSQIGDKRYIAMRGIFAEFQNKEASLAVYECGRNLLHEIGHSLGLNHNFQAGPDGDQCDECDDNGCPEQGTSNNLMDYWPKYGHAISGCQLEIVRSHLSGWRGNISDVVVNESCERHPGGAILVIKDSLLSVEDSLYVSGSIHVMAGGHLALSGFLSIPAGDSIVIYPGGKLEVAGGIIANACGDLWKGIRIGTKDSTGQLEDPIIVVNQHGRIQQAELGLLVDQQADVRLHQAGFFNCITSIAVQAFDREIQILDVGFSANERYPRREWGAGLESFIHLVGANLIIEDCVFQNLDPFRTNLETTSGYGIQSFGSRLNVQSSSFSNLKIGVFHSGLDESNTLLANQLQFLLCLAGIQLFQTPFAKVEHSSFQVERFEDQDAFGIVAEEPGWLAVNHNHFYSDFGASSQTAVLVDHPRGGTQFLNNNTIDSLFAGFIHLAEVGEPIWPEDLISIAESADPNASRGLVLASNHVKKVSIPYAMLPPTGQGLAQIAPDSEVKLMEYNHSFSWPMGGLSLFAQGKHQTAMVVGDIRGQRFPELDHNFRWNARTNTLDIHTDDTLGIFPEMELKQLAQWWTGYQGQQIAPGNVIERWIDLKSVLHDHPEWGLRNADLERLIEDTADWPAAVLIEMAELIEATDPPERSYLLSNIMMASRQFDGMQLGIGSWHELLESGSRTASSLPLSNPIQSSPLQLSFPDGVYGNPGFTIFPNPVQKHLSIRPESRSDWFDEPYLDYSLYNMSGQVLKSGSIRGVSDLLLDVSQFSSGIYSIAIRNQKTFLGLRKFIILRD